MNLINLFENYGYRVKYQDKNRYVKLYKPFKNSNPHVEPHEEKQIGRIIEIYNGEIWSIPYMKRGYYWSNSAVTTHEKGCIFQLGERRIIAKVDNSTMIG